MKIRTALLNGYALARCELCGRLFLFSGRYFRRLCNSCIPLRKKQTELKQSKVKKHNGLLLSQFTIEKQTGIKWLD